VFDPEDKGPASWQKRGAILAAIASLPTIKDPSSALSTALTADDTTKLWAMVEDLDARVEKCLAAKQFLAVADALCILARFELVGQGIAEAATVSVSSRVLAHVDATAMRAQSAAILGRLSEAKATTAEISALVEAIKVPFIDVVCLI